MPSCEKQVHPRNTANSRPPPVSSSSLRSTLFLPSLSPCTSSPRSSTLPHSPAHVIVLVIYFPLTLTLIIQSSFKNLEPGINTQSGPFQCQYSFRSHFKQFLMTNEVKSNSILLMLNVPNHSTKIWSFVYSFLSVDKWLMILYLVLTLYIALSLWTVYLSPHPSDNNRCWPLSACYRVPAPLCSSPRYPWGTRLPRGTTGRSEHTGAPPPVCSLQRETKRFEWSTFERRYLMGPDRLDKNLLVGGFGHVSWHMINE